MTNQQLESKIDNVCRRLNIGRDNTKMRSVLALSYKKLNEATIERCIRYSKKPNIENPAGYLRRSLNYELDRAGR